MNDQDISIEPHVAHELRPRRSRLVSSDDLNMDANSADVSKHYNNTNRYILIVFAIIVVLLVLVIIFLIYNDKDKDKNMENKNVSENPPGAASQNPGNTRLRRQQVPSRSDEGVPTQYNLPNVSNPYYNSQQYAVPQHRAAQYPVSRYTPTSAQYYHMLSPNLHTQSEHIVISETARLPSPPSRDTQASDKSAEADAEISDMVRKLSSDKNQDEMRQRLIKDINESND